MPLKDAVLIHRLKTGDRPTFEMVVHEYYQSVFRQHWRHCGDIELASDLTQETFVQAWRSLHLYQGRSSLRTWLFTIAVRVWRRSLTNDKSSIHDSQSETVLDGIAETSPGPSECLDELLAQERIGKALERLPNLYREAVVLFYIQNLTYKEIADALEIPLGTVKSRLHEGLSRLRRSLQNAMEDGVLK